MGGFNPERSGPASKPVRLLFCGDWLDVHATARPIKAHLSVDEREDRVIAAQPDVPSGQKLRSALPNDDIAGDDYFAAKLLHTQAFADAVPPVLNAALSLFMCHFGELRVGG